MTDPRGDIKAGHPCSRQDTSEGHPDSRAHYGIACGFGFACPIPSSAQLDFLPSTTDVDWPQEHSPVNFLPTDLHLRVFSRESTADSWKRISGLGRRVCLRNRNLGTICHNKDGGSGIVGEMMGGEGSERRDCILGNGDLHWGGGKRKNRQRTEQRHDNAGLRTLFQEGQPVSDSRRLTESRPLLLI